MKRVLSILLCLCFVLSFAACGSDKDTSSSVSPASTGTDSTQPSSSTTASGEAPKPTEQSGDDSSKSASDFEKFNADGSYIPYNFDTMKIMKLTQWDVSGESLVVANGTQKFKHVFYVTADRVMRNIAEAGYNTVLLQLRPFADSYYQSEYYPLSEFVSGSYANQTTKYDVVEIFIEKAHKYGLSIHGWINPMRCMTADQLNQVTGDWAIKKWFEALGNESSPYSQYMFQETDAGGTKRLYLNPAYQEVRDLITNGIVEICKNYKVDGIFMDDYFYPSSVLNKKSIDSLAYEAREDASQTVFKFRCEAIDTLVKGIYSSIKEVNPALIYGISPNGEIDTCYNSECADVYTWCAEDGYVDIMYPQFYYGMLHKASSIDTLTEKWASIMSNDKIKLVPILTLHKAGLDDQWAQSTIGRTEWIDHHDVLLEELTYLMTNKTKKISGTGFFCYAYFFNGGKATPEVNQEIQNFTFLFDAFEQYNGCELTDLTQIFKDNGLDLNAKISEWNDFIVEARNKEVF